MPDRWIRTFSWGGLTFLPLSLPPILLYLLLLLLLQQPEVRPDSPGTCLTWRWGQEVISSDKEDSTGHSWKQECQIIDFPLLVCITNPKGLNNIWIQYMYIYKYKHIQINIYMCIYMNTYMFISIYIFIYIILEAFIRVRKNMRMWYLYAFRTQQFFFCILISEGEDLNILVNKDVSWMHSLEYLIKH